MNDFIERKKGESVSDYDKRVLGLSDSEYKSAREWEKKIKKISSGSIDKLSKRYKSKDPDTFKFKKGTDIQSIAKDAAIAGKRIAEDAKKYKKSTASPKKKQKYEKEYEKSLKSDAGVLAMYGKEARRGKGYMRRPQLESGGTVYRGRKYASGGRVAKYKG